MAVKMMMMMMMDNEQMNVYHLLNNFIDEAGLEICFVVDWKYMDWM